MKFHLFDSHTALAQGMKRAVVLPVVTVMTGMIALPAFALVNPVPIARDAVRLKMNQDEPARRDITFDRGRVRRGSGHTRYVVGGGSFIGGRGLRHFTYTVNVDTGNGAVNGVTYHVR